MSFCSPVIGIKYCETPRYGKTKFEVMSEDVPELRLILVEILYKDTSMSSEMSSRKFSDLSAEMLTVNLKCESWILPVSSWSFGKGSLIGTTKFGWFKSAYYILLQKTTSCQTFKRTYSQAFVCSSRRILHVCRRTVYIWGTRADTKLKEFYRNEPIKVYSLTLDFLRLIHK